MSRSSQRQFPEFLDAVAENVSPPLESVDFGALLDKLVAWSRAQEPRLEERTNAARTTISYAIRDNDVLVWRVVPRLKDGAKVEVLPRSSELLPVRARRAFVKLLVALSPGADLEPDRRFMIPMHNLVPPRSMKQFLVLLDLALKAGRSLRPAVAA